MGGNMEEQMRSDIRATLALSYAEALNGTTRTLTLPEGRQVTVSLPAGTHDGQEIRLANQGEIPPGGGLPGALILTVVVAPPAYLDTPPYAQQGLDAPTELIAPPPPPSASPSLGYPPIGPGGAFTRYSPQEIGGDSSYPPPPPLMQSTQQPRSQPPRSLTPSIIIVLLILALLIIAGSGLINATRVIRPARISAQASATAQARTPGTAQAVATAQTQATATVIAQANASATATATALQNIYIQATGGTPVLSDLLSHQDSHNWDESANCAFVGGTYHASSSQTGNFFTCTANAQLSNYSDFTFQVQMAIFQGDYGGMFFRANSSGTDYYTLTVDQSGQYSLDVYKNNNYLKTVSNASSSAFKTGLNQSNLITVVARSSTFYLYMNGQFVARASDTNYNAGQIGLLAGDNTHPTEVAFSNLKVWQV